LSLNGTIGIQGQDRAKGALSYATQLLSTSQPIPAPRWLEDAIRQLKLLAKRLEA